MSIAEMILPEFDHEFANTRKTLERVPDAKWDWKPHAKSGSVGWLSVHLSNIPSWAAEILLKESLDMAPGGVPMAPPPAPKNVKDMLANFDKSVAVARKAIAGASDADYMKNWSFLNNGQVLFTSSRLAALRGWVLSHNVHHRAQLGVCFRLNDIAVPAIYGPSADEGMM
jgi:uncharacterized damage-inducible protein DinB